ncbi:hypothetical protein BaRGS_00018708, partial [Batillaria attramentaria]
MFDECLINSMTARSELDCARRCSSDPNCKTFTFTKGSPHWHVPSSSSRHDVTKSTVGGARCTIVHGEDRGRFIMLMDGRKVNVEDWM